MKWLKDLLGEEKYKLLSEDAIKAITEKIGTKVVSIVDEKDFFPKDRIDKILSENKDLKTELTASKESLAKIQAEVETLKKGDDKGKKTLEEQVSNLTKALDDLKKESTTKDQQLQLRDKRSVVESALRSAKANEAYLATLMREFELKHPLDKLEIVDGKIKDAETILKPFQESFKPMFGEVKQKGYNPNPGDGNGAGDYYSMEQLKTMSKAEVSTNMEKVNKSLEFLNSQGQ